MPVAFSDTLRSLEHDHARSHWIWGGVGALLLALWAAWLWSADLTQWEVSSRARLEVSTRPQPLAFPVAGVVRRVLVGVGQAVEPGDTLVELDDTELRVQENEWQGRLAALQARATSLHAELRLRQGVLVAVADAQLAQSNAQVHRQTQTDAQRRFQTWLAKQLALSAEAGGTAVTEVQKAQMETELSTAQQAVLQQEAKKLVAEGQQALAQAQAQLENLVRQQRELASERHTATAQLASTRHRLDQTHLKAPAKGVVGDQQALGPGSHVGAGQALLTLLPDGPLIAAGEFPSTAIGRLQAGQSARLALHAYDWKRHGHVALALVRVSQEPRDGWVRAEFRIDPTSTTAPLQHGLPGRIEVSTGTDKPVHLLLATVLGHAKPPGQAASQP